VFVGRERDAAVVGQRSTRGSSSLAEARSARGLPGCLPRTTIRGLAWSRFVRAKR
jgi:hypothetical protein